MAIKEITAGHRQIEMRYLMDYNFQDLLATVNDPVEQVDPTTIKRIGPGMSIFELRRTLNDNFAQLNTDLGPIVGIDTTLGGGDFDDKIKRVTNANFALIVATL